MSNSETRADIIAEMRNRADTVVNGRVITARNFVPQETVEDWADRIEAAERRERAALVAEAEAAKDARNRVAVRLRDEFAEKCKACKSASGDAAAMREALEEQLRYWDTHFRTRDEEALRQHIEAALAAPARNCDRFTDEVDAQLAFLNEVWLISVTRETMLERDKFDNWTCEMRSEFAHWLLATADGGTK